MSSPLDKLIKLVPLPLKISHKIVLLIFVLLLIVLSTVGILAERILVLRLEESLEQNALDLAHAIAGISEVQQHVGQEEGYTVIQPLVENIRAKTEAEFIVVMDMHSVRYSHPVPERIGEKFVGGDEGQALLGETYTSVAIGTLGQSLRAFVPINLDGVQVGVVSVGILMDDIMIMIGQLRQQVALAALVGLFLGLLGSGYLAWNIKGSLFGMEPHKISALLNERVALLESVREGIIAFDNDGRVIFTNGEARKLLGLGTKPAGREARDILPGLPIKSVLESGLSLENVEMNLSGARVLSNSVPIRDEKKQILGVIVSFRDMTEIRKLASELSGVMRYVETLRVQNHEFNNKLHTISGLIQLGEYDQAVNFITREAAARQELVSFVSERIKDPAVAAVLLGKVGRARELGLELEVDRNSFLSGKQKIEGTRLATIIGNLVDNAMDALQSRADGEKRVKVSLYDERAGMGIIVEDNGAGITTDPVEKIFEKGFTTGKDDRQGLGLYLVKSFVDELKGELKVESSAGKGTRIELHIPGDEQL